MVMPSSVQVKWQNGFRMDVVRAIVPVLAALKLLGHVSPSAAMRAAHENRNRIVGTKYRLRGNTHATHLLSCGIVKGLLWLPLPVFALPHQKFACAHRLCHDFFHDAFHPHALRALYQYQVAFLQERIEGFAGICRHIE